MNILWIEDQEQLLQQFCLKTYDESKKIKLSIPIGFDNAWKETCAAVKDYDLFILDIDLSDFSKMESNTADELCKKFELTKDEFYKEAGFHIYLKLKMEGIQDSRIIFLTGNFEDRNEKVNLINKIIKAPKDTKEEISNLKRILDTENKKTLEESYEKAVEAKDLKVFTDFLEHLLKTDNKNIEKAKKQTYSAFKEKFHSARIQTADGISKQDIDADKQLTEWLDKRITPSNKFDGIDTNYTILRRGILEGIKFWKEEIDKYIKSNGEEKFKNEFCLFNRGFRDNDNKKNYSYIVGYLKKLSQLLPQNINSEIKPDVFSLFIKELSSEWEDSFKINYNFPVRNIINNLSNRIMKILRNFTSHMLLSKIDEKDIGYLFIIAMRAMFKSSDAKINNYEKNFEQLFEKIEYKFDKDLLQKQFNKVIQKIDNPRILNEKYFDPFNIYYSMFYSTNIFKDKTKENLGIKVFYNFFWQELYTCEYSLKAIPKITLCNGIYILEPKIEDSVFSYKDYNKSEFSEFIKSITYTKAFE